MARNCKPTANTSPENVMPMETVPSPLGSRYEVGGMTIGEEYSSLTSTMEG